MQGGASPQLVAPGLLAGAEDDNDSNNNTSQHSTNLVLSLSPVVQAHDPLTEHDAAPPIQVDHGAVHAVGDIHPQPEVPVVAPVLQEELLHLAGLQAARLAGREAAWELQQNAVQGDQGAEGGGGDQAVSIQGERGSLVDRLVPVVPPPVNREISEDGFGWDLIDRVGGWRSNLCQFPVLEQVPYQHRVVWNWAFSEVLRRIQNTDEGRELDRGLMWLSFLPQALLH